MNPYTGNDLYYLFLCVSAMIFNKLYDIKVSTQPGIAY